MNTPQLQAVNSDRAGSPGSVCSVDSKIDADPVSILSRAFLLLGTFQEQPVLGVSELARKTGLPRTTVHRLATQLVEVGALSRVGVRFRLGPTLFVLGNLHFPPRMRETLQPFLEDLRDISGADVALLEPAEADVIVIQTAKQRRSTSQMLRLGNRLPVETCSGGRILKAFNVTRPSRQQQALLTIGFDLDQGVAEPGRTSVGAPIHNRNRRVLGALMVSAPTVLVGDELDQFVATVVRFANTFTLAGQPAEIDFLARARPRLRPLPN